MMLSARRSAGPLLAAALLALDAGAARAQGQIVRLPEQDRRLAGTAAEVFSIGEAEGAEHEMFGIVGGVAFDASDNLYVLDRQQARVMVYDRTGRFLRQIGRKGEGPGELIVPTQIAIGEDGTIVISDLGRDVFSLFRSDGTFVRNAQFGGWMPAGAGLAWHPSGAMVGPFRRSMLNQLRPGQQVSGTQSTPVLAVPLNGGEARRVFEVPAQERVEQRNESPAPGQNQVMFRVSPPPVFTPPVLYGVLPNGNVALSFTSGYTVRIVDLNGQTLRYLQRPMRTRRTTQADRDRYVERRRQEIATGRAGIVITRGDGPGAPRGRSQDQIRQMMERQLAETQFADTIPALQGVRVSPSGKLLVERTAQNVGDPGPVDVITPEGEYVGTFHGVGLPDAMSRSGLAAYVEDDENGVQRVVVRRLPDSWR